MKSASNISTADESVDLSKTARVYSVLRRRIRDLELPPGTLLRKNELAAEFSVSRAPISEALAKLADEGRLHPALGAMQL